MLESLKRLNGGSVHLPGRVKDHPDRDRLALRFERFGRWREMDFSGAENQNQGAA
jgi:hypothetical protein